MVFRIEYSPDAETHLRALPKHAQRRVLDTVDMQLIHLPLTETRHRKPMRPNIVAPWELRIGDLRVYYDVDVSESVVLVLAVGVKRRNRVWIGDQEFEL